MYNPTKEDREKYALLAKEIYRLNNFLLEERNIPLLKELVEITLRNTRQESPGRSALKYALSHGLHELEQRQRVLYYLHICTVKINDDNTALFIAEGRGLFLDGGTLIYVYHGHENENPYDFTLSAKFPKGIAFRGFSLDEPWDKNILHCSSFTFNMCTVY